MNHQELYHKVTLRCSKLVTRAYSTSFSLGIQCLEKSLQDPIYSIYGFVRFADEIVDTFHDHDKADLLARFKAETYLIGETTKAKEYATFFNEAANNVIKKNIKP